MPTRPTIKARTYEAFGLKISSDLDIPELISLEGTQRQVEIRLGPVFSKCNCTTDEGYHCIITADETWLEWDIVGRFTVRNGKRITVDPAPGVDERIVRVPLLGMVMAALLIQRGFLVLHGSVLGMGGAAVAFLGDKGLGKSTLAAALYARGHHLLSDDIVAIRVPASKPPVVWPAFPQFKLWPEAASAIFGFEAEELPRLHPKLEKRALSALPRFERQPLPLSRIYILSPRPSAGIEPLSPQEAFMEIIRNSYLSRFWDQSDRSAEALQLSGCSKLLRFASIHRLTHSFALSRLGELADMVEQHTRTLARVRHGIQAGAAESPRVSPGRGKL